MNWSVFFKRLMSAIVFCAVLIAGLTTSFEVMLTVMLLIQFLCVKEAWSLFLKIDKDAFYPNVLYWMVQFFALLIVIGIALWSHLEDVLYILFVIPVLLLLFGVLGKGNALKAALSGIASLLYVAIPIGSVVAMFMQYRGGGIYANVPLALILLIWTNDTMAYITGSFIGKTPFSAISPKKTWEGTIGGVVFTVVSVVLLNYLNWMPHIKLQDWIALALIASIIGTAGDLLESKLKRIADVKDSGNIMPGHGGALDRFDSMLVSLPFAYCYAMLFMVSSQA